MEHFAQTNVFVRIQTIFAQIWTIFAHSIIGCTIRYPKIDNLPYIAIDDHLTGEKIGLLFRPINWLLTLLGVSR